MYIVEAGQYPTAMVEAQCLRSIGHDVQGLVVIGRAHMDYTL